MDYILEVNELTKTFPGVKALDKVQIKIESGEVHAVCGENGAGKSTLMKILGGVYSADSGEIKINGQYVHIKSVSDSNDFGISVIYQEFNLVPELTVAENIFISELPKYRALNLLNLRQLNNNTQALLERLNINIRPDRYVKDLSVSEKQMVEIAKSLSQNSQIIIMDEPTAALNNQEVDKLYKIIEMLKSQNKTIIYISHRMKEIFDITDSVTVLRDGQYIGTEKTVNLNEEKIVKMMVGRDIENYYHSEEKHKKGDVILKVNDLNKNNIFENISFELRSGEILGMAGLMGCGREEIVKAIYGIQNIDSGEIYINDKKVNIKTPLDAIRNKIAFVTEDRKDSGIFPLLSVTENISMSIIRRLCKLLGIYIDVEKEKDVLKEYTNYMNIKYADKEQKIMSLSGGNQQKIILSRALATNCEILILLEPTRGIDVGAKSEIYNLLYELAQKGIAIIMVSSEMHEILSVCDRVIVVHQGKITGDLNNEDIEETNVMFCATGNKEIFSNERCVK